MRITAGLCLIFAAILNLFAALGYLGGGALATGFDTMSEAVVEETARQNPNQVTDQQRAQMQKASQGVGTVVKGVGGLLMALGVFLLVSVGVLIAGAVFLFQGKNWKFILGAGIVAIAAEACGILVTEFGIMNLPGLVGGVLAIVAAITMSKPAAAW